MSLWARYRAVFLATCVPVLLGIAVLLWLSQPVWMANHRELRTGRNIITKVELFKNKEARLPESLEELGINDPDLDVYYQKISSEEYQVWFGTSLGESEVFNSRTRKWE